MEILKINRFEDNDIINTNKNNFSKNISSISNRNKFFVLWIINIIIIMYIIIKIKKISVLINILIDFKNKYKINNNLNDYFPKNDKEMMSLHYPEINYDNIKNKLYINNNIITAFLDLLNQLEKKLLYLEKEINITKLVSFYTSRKFFLKEKNIIYDENNITELHEIINWIIIHKSDQIKGIASDKYLSCKYVELKLGINLCRQRLAVFNKFEDINYNNLKKYGNIVLKISNSCWASIFISNNTDIHNFQMKIQKFKRLYESEHGLKEAQFFHLYSKKRIIVEKQFIPREDLYEFRFFIINNNIKFIMLSCYLHNKFINFVYDYNFNFLFKEKKVIESPLNITSIFQMTLLEKLIKYANKLSEDFQNFIRIDLYIFHNEIFFSELTFASVNGLPMYRTEKFVLNSVKNYSRVDTFY